MFKFKILDSEFSSCHHTVIKAPHIHHESSEIFGIQGSTKALANQCRIVCQMFWYSPVGKNIREIEFASRFQNTEDFGKDPPLFRREIDDTIGDHDINGSGLDPQSLKVFDVPV